MYGCYCISPKEFSNSSRYFLWFSNFLQTFSILAGGAMSLKISCIFSFLEEGSSLLFVYRRDYFFDLFQVLVKVNLSDEKVKFSVPRCKRRISDANLKSTNFLVWKIFPSFPTGKLGKCQVCRNFLRRTFVHI